mgnify:CR=1 FL=1
MQIRKQNSIRLKPGVSRTAHLFAASFFWTVAGSILMIRGWFWIGSGKARWLVLLALAAGSVKSRFVLDKTAGKILRRISGMEDGTCIGAVFSWKTWLLVGLMMAAGISLRIFFHPGMVIGTLYMAIGWALFLSSRNAWLMWFRRVHHNN